MVSPECNMDFISFLFNKEDIEFMNNFYKEFGGDDNDS